jgi:hypothetical protein
MSKDHIERRPIEIENLKGPFRRQNIVDVGMTRFNSNSFNADSIAVPASAPDPIKQARA